MQWKEKPKDAPTGCTEKVLLITLEDVTLGGVTGSKVLKFIKNKLPVWIQAPGNSVIQYRRAREVRSAFGS